MIIHALLIPLCYHYTLTLAFELFLFYVVLLLPRYLLLVFVIFTVFSYIIGSSLLFISFFGHFWLENVLLFRVFEPLLSVFIDIPTLICEWLSTLHIFVAIQQVFLKNFAIFWFCSSGYFLLEVDLRSSEGAFKFYLSVLLVWVRF